MDRERSDVPPARQVAEIVRAASLMVSCRACGELHKPECPLDLHPVCSSCSGRYDLASLHMGRCHALCEAKIDEEVTRISPGNYALGFLDDETFVAFYVGRSSSDVNDRLHSWIGVDSRSAHYGASAQAAYGSRRRRSLPLGMPVLRPVDVAVDGRYTHFRFSYAASAEAAFAKECHNYHDFGGSYGLDNERHPVPQEGEPWICPVHGQHHR